MTGNGAGSAYAAHEEQLAIIAQGEIWLRQFFDIMVATDQCQPEYWPLWRAQARENADLWPIMRGGKMIGGVFFKGHIVHIAIHPDWHRRWATPGLMRAYATWTHDVEIVTHPLTSNTAACQLAERLGFVKRGQHKQFTIYVKEPKPCHQPS